MEISVIVPVYNVKEYLPRCMDSLLAQSFSDWEIILVDDGSTDGSGTLCDAYAHRQGITALHQENAGLGMARNAGLAAASGTYVAFMDSDDYAGPHLLRELYDAAKAQEADVAIGGHTVEYPNGSRSVRPWVQEARLFAGAGIRELLLNTVGSLPEEPMDTKYGVSACGRLYRRSLLEEAHIRFFSEHRMISEDLIFNIDFLRRAKRAVVVPETSYYYCIHRGTLSRRHRTDRFARDCALYRAVEERLAADFAPEESALYLHRLLVSRARYDIEQEAAYGRGADGGSLRQRVQAIVENEALQTALIDYPWKKLPKMQGVFARMMQKKRSRILILLVWVRRLFLPGTQIV